MNIIVACTLVVCLLDLSAAVRLRESLNVLVPSNDVNLHAKIKKLLNGDAVGSEDFSDNEIQRFFEMRFPKVEKLRNSKHFPVNKVFDDKNKNIEENQIDHDSDELQSTLDDVMSLDSIAADLNVTTSNLNGTSDCTTDSSSTTLNSTTSPNETTTGSFETTDPETESSTDTATSLNSTDSPTTLNYTSTKNTTLSTRSTTPICPNAHDAKCSLIREIGNYLQWLHGNARLNIEYINRRNPGNYSTIYKSMAYKNLTETPTAQELENVKTTLEYLSLAGNYFKVLSFNSSLPNLKELDLRSCSIESILRGAFHNFIRLEKLFLSCNTIKTLTNSFPASLAHLDLSYNLILDQMAVDKDALKNLTALKTLDLSFSSNADHLTVINPLLNHLIGLSLCNLPNVVQLQRVNFTSSGSLKYLDISGATFDRETFERLPVSLEALTVKSSVITDLKWAAKLVNLQHLDLNDNRIHKITSDPFRHMTNLTNVNLESNTAQWSTRLFSISYNPHMNFLNLRDNNLVSLTPAMEDDLMSVNIVAIGKNEFECRCELQKLMDIFIENTRLANLTEHVHQNYIDSESEGSLEGATSDPTRGVRNQIRPQYDVMSRTYQKYYDMAKHSVEAIRIKAFDSSVFRFTPRSLTMQSSAKRLSGRSSFRTVLFDYIDGDYLCEDAKNPLADSKQPIIDTTDLCVADQVADDDAPAYRSARYKALIALSISFPTVIFVSALLLVVYWKWWYIKYFFVLCRNSAILTFMDDSDGGKEAIIKRNSGDDAVDVYLYDVFVSYCDQNREWVLDEFIPNVERRETINVCLHERDFQVGYGILENIVSCMDRSRCLLLLISENFLLSQWCQFEMNLAQHRLLETRRDKLILVILEDIPVRKQPKTLKYLMRTKTYIKWPVNGTSDERQVFWKRLKKAIISSKWENDTYGSIA